VFRSGCVRVSVPMIRRERQFAEKLYAYTLPRTAAPNSRVRDLVDMVLLIRSGTLESGRVVQALHATFDLRATHSVPKALDPAPEEWIAPFSRPAAECRLELSASVTFSPRSVDGRAVSASFQLADVWRVLGLSVCLRVRHGGPDVRGRGGHRRPFLRVPSPKAGVG
jgi:hypothetical protein